jgi:hypothetical protein
VVGLSHLMQESSDAIDVGHGPTLLQLLPVAGTSSDSDRPERSATQN